MTSSGSKEMSERAAIIKKLFKSYLSTINNKFEFISNLICLIYIFKINSVWRNVKNGMRWAIGWKK